MSWWKEILLPKPKEIIPDGGDLAEMLADATAEQVKQLNQEINDAITMAGNSSLTQSDVAFFVDRMRDILKIDWSPGFLDKDYESKDKSYFHITSAENKTYTFHYYDADGELMWGGRCSIDPSYIFVQVSVLDEKCDLLRNPKNVGDIVAIPYVEGYQSVSLGSSTAGDVKFKAFSQKEVNVEDQVVFHDENQGYTSFYNSEYQVYFTDRSDGHYMEISKYLGNNETETIFRAYYTASENNDLGLTIISFKKTLRNGESTIFANENWKEGDMILGSYYKPEDGISINIGSNEFVFHNEVSIEGVWRTANESAEFDLGSSWGYYRCSSRLFLMLRISVNQYENAVRFRVSYAYDTTQSRAESVKILLPSGEEITVDCKDYTVPFKLEKKKGVEYLTFTLFGYEFVLHKVADG